MADSLGSSSSEIMTNVQAECGCCFFEFLLENMVQCEKGHRCCFECLRRQVEEIIYRNSKAHASLPCLHMDYKCKESIRLSEIQRALPAAVFERYEECQAQEAVIEAKLENLVYCPFCSIPCEVDKCVQVFDCPNPKCLMASCIQCKELSHIPLPCEEIDNTSETAARRKVEERMAKAVIKECKTCNVAIVKSYGCNVVTCTKCRTTMCYVCRQAISSSSEHFCDHPFEGQTGKRCFCQICKVDKCRLFHAEVEDNVALDAKEEALKEFGHKEPNLLDQKIGPPLVRQTVVQPSDLFEVEVLEEGQYIPQQLQVAPNMAIPLPAVPDQVANMAIPLPAVRRVANMAIPLPVAPPQIVRADDELANMQLQANEDDGSQEHNAEDKGAINADSSRYAIRFKRERDDSDGEADHEGGTRKKLS